MKRYASAKAVKKSGVRAIDQGTVYDVTGMLRQLTRRIENGGEGFITDALVVVRRSNGSIGTFNYGTGGRDRAHYMASTAKNRLEPA